MVSAGGHGLANAERAVESGEADAMAFGRLFIADPDLVKCLKSRVPLSPYNRTTFYGGTEVGYTDYPALAAAPAT